MAGAVLIGYDGQASSRTAIVTAVSVAKAFERPLVIVFGYAPVPMGGQVADLGRAVEELGERITDEAVQIAKDIDASVEVQVELVNDRPADALLRAADAHDAMVIVVGSTNRGPVAGALLGSVSYQVVHRSSRPVLVVPLHGTTGGQSER